MMIKYSDAYTHLYKRIMKESEKRNNCISFARYQAQPIHCRNT